MTATSEAARRGNRTPCGAFALLLALGLATACSTTPPAPAPPAAPGGWLAAAQRHIAEREYRASQNGAGLQAPNRAHDLRTLFAPTGITVRDRIAGAPLLGLAVSGIGRGAQLARVAAGEVTVEGARVEIRRPGFVEWYVNSPAGLEQGFTLATRPGGEGPLAIELALHGATASLRGESLVLATAQGRQLSYGKLAAFDSFFKVDYDIGVYRIESNQIGAQLGATVAAAGSINWDGDVDLIVGAPLYDTTQIDAGAAFAHLLPEPGVRLAFGCGAALLAALRRGRTRA